MDVGVHVPRCLKEGLAWATDKCLWVVTNLLIKTATPLKLKNKGVLSVNNIVCIAMWSLVMYCNCFVIYYQLMLHGSTIKVYFMFSSM